MKIKLLILFNPVPTHRIRRGLALVRDVVIGDVIIRAVGLIRHTAARPDPIADRIQDRVAPIPAPTPDPRRDPTPHIPVPEVVPGRKVRTLRLYLLLTIRC